MEQVIIYLFVVGVTVFLTLTAIKYAQAYHFFIKKLLHIAAILLCAHASITLPTIPLFFIVFFSFFILLFAILNGFLSDPLTKEKEWGVLYFVAVFGLMLGMTWLFNKSELKTTTAFSLTILAVSDGLAGFIGRWAFLKNKNTRLPLSKSKTDDLFTDGKKTLYGFGAFFISCTLIVVIFNFYYTNFIFTEIIVVSLVVSTVLAFLELMSSKGSDNLSVTLMSFLLLTWLRNQTFEEIFSISTSQLFVSFLISILIIMGLWRVKFLTFSGGIMAWLLAFVVLILCKQSLFPLLVFLIVGSLIGKLPVNVNIVSDDRFRKPRNSIQVLANGGVILVLGLLNWSLGVMEITWLSESQLAKLMLVSVAICMSDTVSSELGSRFGGKPFDLLSFKTVLSGVSGGVTLVGSMFGFMGSTLIIMLGSYQISMSNEEKMLFILLGFIGMLVDSLLGSMLQFKVLVNRQWIDVVENVNGFPTRGYRFFSNNMVNLFSNLIVVGIVILLFFNQ